MLEIILYGISVLSFAGLAIMVYGYTTAPEGYEDRYGFHYRRSPRVNASHRRVAVRSQHNAKHRTRPHRKVAA